LLFTQASQAGSSHYANAKIQTRLKHSLADFTLHPLICSMEVTHLSNQGEVLIPKALRDAHHWEAGQELVAIDVGDGILLKPKKPFPETVLSNVAGCLNYRGEAKNLADFEAAIGQGVAEQWHDRS
jgi:AbrB family looped-hinge helix DNA binding protein